MAKIKGPLMSQKAQGSLGGIITFQGGIGPGQVHIKKTPPDKRSASQIEKRATVSLAATEYARESQTIKTTFDTLAANKKIISGYNLYQKVFLLFYSNWARFNKAKFNKAKFGSPKKALDKI